MGKEVLPFLAATDVTFPFEKVDDLVSNMYKSLEHCKMVLQRQLNSRSKTLSVVQNNIMKYQCEEKVKVSEQEREILGKTTALIEKNDLLKTIVGIKRDSCQEIKNTINNKISAADLLENKQQALLSEKSKVVKNLERTKKAYSFALAYYQNFLRMTISLSVKDERFDITFFHKKECGKNSTFSIIKKGDSFVLYDGTVCYNQFQLMAELCQKRRKWLMDS